MSAIDLADAQRQCLAAGVDLRVSGKGMSDCASLMMPFCPFGVESDITQQLPKCGPPPPSAAKAAIELKEAQKIAAANAPFPYLLVGAGALVVVGLGWLLLSD